MNKKLFMLFLTTTLIFTGCTGVKITGPELKDMHEASMEAKTACYEALEAEALEIAESIAALPKDQQIIHLLVKSQEKNMEIMASALTGKTYDKCGGGTNVYEYLARVAESQNEAVGKGVDAGGAVATTGLITLGVTSGINAVMDGVGGNINFNGNNNSDIGNSTPSTVIQSQAGATTGANTNAPATAPSTSEEGLPEGFVAPGCSAESRAEGRC